MINYKMILDEMRKEVGPIAKIFLDKAMEVLEIDEINDSNYKDVLEILKGNKELREYIIEIERRFSQS
jgi:hypothetical protein